MVCYIIVSYNIVYYITLVILYCIIKVWAGPVARGKLSVEEESKASGQLSSSA